MNKFLILFFNTAFIFTCDNNLINAMKKNTIQTKNKETVEEFSEEADKELTEFFKTLQLEPQKAKITLNTTTFHNVKQFCETTLEKQKEKKQKTEQQSNIVPITQTTKHKKKTKSYEKKSSLQNKPAQKKSALIISNNIENTLKKKENNQATRPNTQSNKKKNNKKNKNDNNDIFLDNLIKQNEIEKEKKQRKSEEQKKIHTLLITEDEDGNSVMHRAILDNNLNILEMCLENKIHLYITTNKDGLTAYGLALKLKNFDIIDLFHKYQYKITTKSISPIHEIRSIDELKNYAQGKNELNKRTNRGETLLHLVCEESTILNFNFIKYLVEDLAFSCDEQDFKSFQTPLHLWMDNEEPSKEKEKIALYLLDHMENINHKDYENETLLHYAACNNYGKLTEKLIQQGADINAVSKKKNTPLHNAIKYESADVIRILLRADADTTITNSREKKAFELINNEFINHEKNKSLKSLIAYSQWKCKEKPYYGMLHFYCIQKSPEEIIKLLDYSIPRNNSDSHGLTPLMYAIIEKKSHIIDLLVSQGCRLDRYDFDGNNVLHIAYATGHTPTIEAVINECKKYNYYEMLSKERNKDGKIPLKITFDELSK